MYRIMTHVPVLRFMYEPLTEAFQWSCEQDVKKFLEQCEQV